MEVRGIGAVNATITGGSGNDTFDLAGTLDTNDTVTGGAGTDRVVVSGSETAALADVTEVEEVEIDIDDITDGTTITISGSAIASQLNSFHVRILELTMMTLLSHSPI